ncbi:MAG TPA: trypsin-like peptidase domain-containing protein [Planctomycetota bacterium]|jgi:S1-C subfamily serine protease|nr:trypsin-like peptidase domain-containing protein [Planctomycetota bacterium]
MLPLLFFSLVAQGSSLVRVPDSEEMRNRRITPVVRVAQSASPAVVFIQTNGERRMLARDWWGQVFSRTAPFSVSGSGVVIRKEGFIITNYHVVRDAKEILVSFAAEFDDATYKAAMISFDENEDLALIKITRDRDFSTIPLGHSNDLMPGETVVAIGNPYGQTISVTQGIISGLHRNVPIPQAPDGHVVEFPEMIQTDATINPGNSGGPLLNINGDLVGINTAMNSQAQNIGFAIPVDRVRSVLENQLLSPETAPAWLGFDIEPGDHLCIARVVPGSPAATAGLKPGDCIVAVAGEKVVNQDEYRAARVNLTPLRPAELQVESKGSKRRVKLEPWYREDGILYERFGARFETKSFPRRGVWLRIKELRPGGPAAQLGLEVGDLIDGLKAKSRRGQPWTFESAEALSSLIGTLPKGAELVIEVLRDADKDGSFTSDELLRGTLTLE